MCPHISFALRNGHGMCMCIAHCAFCLSACAFLARSHRCHIATQAEVTSFTFAEACAQPSATRSEFHGADGPVNVVEVDGTFFIENDEAEAKATRSKALSLASEVEAAANLAAAEEVAANPAAMPEPAVAHRISYAAAASKSFGPKHSAAGFGPRPVAATKFSAGIKRSTPASQPAVVPAPLEVSIFIMMHMHVDICRCNARARALRSCAHL